MNQTADRMSKSSISHINTLQSTILLSWQHQNVKTENWDWHPNRRDIIWCTDERWTRVSINWAFVCSHEHSAAEAASYGPASEEHMCQEKMDSTCDELLHHNTILNHITDNSNFRRLHWSNASTLACGARGPRFESRCGQKFVFSRKSVRYAALNTDCTLTGVPRSTQPSTLRGTVNEYKPYGLYSYGLCHMVYGNSPIAMYYYTWQWVNVRPIAAYRQTQRSSLQLGLRVGGHPALTDFRPEEPLWTLAYGSHRRWQHYKISSWVLLFSWRSAIWQTTLITP